MSQIELEQLSQIVNGESNVCSRSKIKFGKMSQIESEMMSQIKSEITSQIE